MTDHQPEVRPESPLVGSQLAATLAHVRNFIASLISAVNAGIDDLDEIATHNVFALYCYLLIHFSSGHRVVTDPHHDLDIFDDKLGLAIIIDKVMQEVRSARMAFLPELACLQLRNYLLHLQALAARVLSRNPQLAAEIFSLTQPAGPRPLPLFFFLAKDLTPIRITPKVLNEEYCAHLKLPLNLNRHDVVSFLLGDGCFAEFAEAHIGHVESGCHPFGSYSTFSPLKVAADVRTRLAQYMEMLGWQPMTGLEIYHKGRLEELRKAMGSIQTRHNYGPALRKLKRAPIWTKDARFVTKIIADVLGPGERTAISDDEVAKMIAKLAKPEETAIIPEGADAEEIATEPQEDDSEEIRPVRFVRRHELLRRELAKMRHRKKNKIDVTLPGKLALAYVEPSPFDEFTLKNARQAGQWRTDFQRELKVRAKSKPKSPPFIERCLAEILVSAVLNGALLFPTAIEALPTALLAQAHRLGDLCWIDIELDPNKKQSPHRRWFTDPISTALLIGLYAARPENGWPGFEPSRLITEIQTLLAALGIADTDTSEPNPTETKIDPITRQLTVLMKPLMVVAANYWQLRLPAVLLNFATGKHLGAALPKNHLFRLLTSRRVHVPQPQSTAAATYGDEDIAAALRNCPSSPSLNYARMFWAELSVIVRTKKDEKGLGGKHPVKKKIDRDTTALLNKKEFKGRLPVIVQCLASWVLHLCRHGTVHKEDLAHKTINTYVNLIGDQLIELAYREDFIKLDEGVYTEIYQRVVTASKFEDKSYVANRLLEFHTFLRETAYVDEVDWQEVYPEGGPRMGGVDAGIVTHAEYRRAISLVIDTNRLTDPIAMTAALFLILGYHFGMRPGEIHRLRRCDIQWGYGFLIVIVKSTLEGDPKSDNGVRQVPLLEPLDELEEKVLSVWLAHFDAIESDKHSPLLRPDSLDFNGMPIGSASVLATKALRLATGDETMRLRHLRHSLASRLSIALLADSRTPVASHIVDLLGGKSGNDVRQFLLGRAEDSRRGFYALSTLLGHHGPSVALGSYIHLLDCVLLDHVSSNTGKLSNEVVAYGLRLPPSHVRTLRRRKTGIHIGGWLLPCPVKHYSAIPELVIAVDDTEPQPIATNDAIERSLSPVNCDRLLCAVTLRDGLMDGLAERFLVDDGIAHAIVNGCKQLQKQSGYLEFGLRDKYSQNVSLADTQWPSDNFRRETRRTRVLLASLDEKFDNATDDGFAKCGQLVSIWITAYHPELNTLLFSEPADLEIFLSSIDVLGIPSTSFSLQIPANSTLAPDIMAKFEKVADDYNVPTGTVTRSPNLVTKASGLRTGRIRLSLISGKTLAGYHRTLQRVIAVLGAWHSGASALNMRTVDDN